MTLLLVFFVLTLAVTATLTWPLLHRHHAGAAHEKREIMVYREQLAEVDNDIVRGLLTKAQAEATRTEIHRRMLAIEDAEMANRHGGRNPFSPGARKVFAGFIIILLPVSAATLYILLGAPELPGKPFASRAIDLGDNKALTWSEMGESVVLAHDGSVVPEALGDFYKALKLDPKDARARFYIGIGEAQIKNFRKAVSILKGLENDSTPDAPWFAMVKEDIETYSKEGGFKASSIKPSQPSEQAPHGLTSAQP